MHNVTLADGTILTEMDGAKAPQLWRAGEREAVLLYLDGDVEQTLQLAQRLRDNSHVTWTSNRGRLQHVDIPLLTVEQVYAHGYPKIDTSWMTNPPTRDQFVAWMPDGVRLGVPA